MTLRKIEAIEEYFRRRATECQGVGDHDSATEYEYSADLAAHVQRVEENLTVHESEGQTAHRLAPVKGAARREVAQCETAGPGTLAYAIEEKRKLDDRREAAQWLKNEIADTKKFLRADGNRTSVYADCKVEAILECLSDNIDNVLGRDHRRSILWRQLEAMAILHRDLAAHVQRVEAQVDEQGASLTGLEAEHIFVPLVDDAARREAAQRLKNEIADTKKFLRADGNRTSVYADYLEDALVEVVRLFPQEFGEERESLSL